MVLTSQVPVSDREELGALIVRLPLFADFPVSMALEMALDEGL